VDKIQSDLAKLKITDDSLSAEDAAVDPSTLLHSEELRKKAYLDQMQKQQEAYLVSLELAELVAKQTEDEVWQSQKYLSEERVMVSDA
jgi:hypothetical protein